MDEEEFRDLNLTYAYQVSNKGRVRTMFGSYKGLIKSQHIDNKGDSVVSIFNGSKLKPKKVFRLVLLAFFNENRPWVRVRHLDGNKQNNNVDNLEIIDL